MDTLTRAAIEKAATEKVVKGATAELEPGTYEVHETFEVHGTITKGEDYEQKFWNSLPLMGMLLRAMNEAGVVLGKGRVKRMVEDVLARDMTSEELLAEKELKKWVSAAQKELSEKATKPATGKTTSSLSVTCLTEAKPYAVETEKETARA